MIAPEPQGARRLSRIGRLSALAAAAALLMTGCSSSNDGKNAPLPRASRPQATAKAKSLVSAVSGAAGLRPGSQAYDSGLKTCVGRQGEEATDGRYYVDYAVNIAVPQAQQAAVGRKIHAYMDHEKYTDVTARPFRTKSDDLVVWGHTGGWFVSVESVIPDSGPDRQILMSVTSPCYLPPGVKQEKF